MSKYYKDIKLDDKYLQRSLHKINKSMTKKDIESILNYIKDGELYTSGICHVHRVINNYLRYYNKFNNEFNNLLLKSVWYSQNISLKLREYKSNYDDGWYKKYTEDNNKLDEDGWNIEMEIKRKNNYDEAKMISIMKDNNNNISYNTEPYNIIIKLLNYNIDNKINKCLKYILWIMYRMELKMIEYEKNK